MTAILYFMFYAWVVGMVLTSVLLIAGVKVLGGRENFTYYFNVTQGKNYQVHHIEWALVISIIFWPHSIVSSIFQTIVNKSTAPVHKEDIDN